MDDDERTATLAAVRPLALVHTDLRATTLFTSGLLSPVYAVVLPVPRADAPPFERTVAVVDLQRRIVFVFVRFKAVELPGAGRAGGQRR